MPTTEDQLEKERQKRLHAEEYRQKLLAVIPGMFRKWEPILGVQSAKVTIRPTRSQWGSCNTRNGISPSACGLVLIRRNVSNM